MKLGYTLLYVDDVEHTMEFYEAALGLKRKFYNIEGDQAYGELDTGPTTLGFVSHSLVQANGLETSRSDAVSPAPPFDLSFVTDDVDAAHTAAVEAGAVSITAPKDKPWGQRVAYVRDPNGMLVAFVTSMEP